jgi:protease I
MATKSKANETEQAGALKGKTIAIIATDGVEQSELLEPRKIFDAAGAKTILISLKSGSIQGYKHQDKGETIKVDQTIDEADAAKFDALLLPGGVANPDALRMNKNVVAFVKSFATAKKPIAAICHGPWTLIEANAVTGKTVTSWPSLKTDLTNAGAKWVDEEVVLSDNLVTSRKPDDIPAFAQKAIELISGKFAAQSRSENGAKLGDEYSGVRLA